MNGRGGYKGAEWAPVVKGACTRHGRREMSMGICMACHREQLEAGRAGPRDGSLEEAAR